MLVLAAMACGSAAPAPAGAPLTVPQLKFAVMDSAGKPAYCDPDYYPIARDGGEQANAIALYPQIKADAPTYSAILAHERLPSGDLTDAQKLTVYRAWKLLRALTLSQSGSGYGFSYVAVGGTPAYQKVSGTVNTSGAVSVSSRQKSGPPMCPICLAASTLIATPDGPRPVIDVKPGTMVWTVDESGARIAEPVELAGSTPVPAGHVMVHLVLADGRELLASPGHRLADGRQLGTLRPGEAVDGSRVTRWELVPYTGERTYDVLPAGPTGFYWAGGILLASTLAMHRS